MKLTIVDPQNDPKLLDWLMTKVLSDARLPYNLYSIIDYGIRLDHLYPNPRSLELLKETEYGDGNTLRFDQAYAAQILNDDATFVDFMSLMHGVIRDEETILMSNYTSKVVMPVLDSLLKFVQQRYGIIGFIVNTIDDLDSLGTSEFGTLQQQMVFSEDCVRYAKLTNKPINTISKEDLEEDVQALQYSQYNGTV